MLLQEIHVQKINSCRCVTVKTIVIHDGGLCVGAHDAVGAGLESLKATSSVERIKYGAVRDM